jgi:histidinol phosphatase-like PHP family hydrolase
MKETPTPTQELPKVKDVDPYGRIKKSKHYDRWLESLEQSELKKEFKRLIEKYFGGTLHNHTERSTGPVDYFESANKDKEMIEYAMALGNKFIALGDHTTNAGNPEVAGLDHSNTKILLGKNKIIQEYNNEYKDIAVLSSIEANIMFYEKDKARIDLDDEGLKQMDYVVASRHMIENEKNIEAIEKSLMAAIENPNVDAIGHPDRYIWDDQTLEKDNNAIPKKELSSKYWKMWDRVLGAMMQNNKVFEINLVSQPQKKLLKMAVDKGVVFSLDLDFHDFSQYKSLPDEERDKLNQAKQFWARGKATDEDVETITKFRNEKFNELPGYIMVRRLMKYMKFLENNDVDSSRVVNSSRERLLKFLSEEKGKTTENLQILNEKFLKDK